jgi:hypothetical protein
MFMSMLCVHVSILHVHALSMLHVDAAFLLHVHVACPRCLSMLHGYSAGQCPHAVHVHMDAACLRPCPCRCCASLSMPHVHADAACPCPCCMSISTLYVHVHAACPCPYFMSISVLHVNVRVASTCPCCMFMLIKYCMFMSPCRVHAPCLC